MNDLSISIFGKKIFLEILNELKLFPKSELSFFDNLDQFSNKKKSRNQIIFFFLTNENKSDFTTIRLKNFPIVVFTPSHIAENQFSNNFVEGLHMPFKILDLKKKVTSLLARYEFKLSSLIHLRDYVIDKNERKIKKNDLELQLTEKEINFLILFAKNKEALSRNFVLKSVWKYSSESDTHTVETHIHRLRKKILEKFNDDNFIKNNNKGYFI